MAQTRRGFLGAAGAMAAVAGLEQVDFGKHRVSRLIVGGNPVSGNSHVSAALDREMADYFTAENVKQLLRACEQAGINVWQSRADRFIIRMLREYRNEGGRIQWVAQTASEMADIRRNIREIAGAGAIGAYHHGTATDAMWRSGKIDEVLERVKVMRDLGLRAGVGTHIPEVIDYIEEKGWEVDFYMTCLYNLSRSREEASKLAGRVVEGEYFHEPDRAQMLERVKRTARQCFVFKVYGASRRCRDEEDRRAALRQVFASAKKSDCVVVGMYPKISEQVLENSRLVAACVGPS
ncbi:MAG: twin-arginine translocation signal domain-containing protein [Acidobacteria bacterium]|nr:twin-arginine translocation signal domain-containing protein [Acidobacteriota bacterium]